MLRCFCITVLQYCSIALFSDWIDPSLFVLFIFRVFFFAVLSFTTLPQSCGMFTGWTTILLYQAVPYYIWLSGLITVLILQCCCSASCYVRMCCVSIFLPCCVILCLHCFVAVFVCCYSCDRSTVAFFQLRLGCDYLWVL